MKVKGVHYTAHPLYENEHPWHDWIYIEWEGYDEPVPAYIDIFLDLRNMTISNMIIRNDSSYNEDDSNENDPITFRHTFLENKIYAVIWSDENISASSCVLPKQKESKYHLPLLVGI